MLVLLSPAKNLNFDPAPISNETTLPRLDEDRTQLVKRTKKLTRADLRRLMKISENLADLNYTRFQAMAAGLPENEAKPAALAFNGDVYRGLDANTLSEDDLSWAQSHLRILSGLYGVLRPLDKIHPYRLEMGTRLDTKRGASLYDFWGSRISSLLNEDAATADDFVINLASNEYFKAVDRKALKPKVIDIAFKEEKDGKAKVISFYAKYARGLMARWIIENRVDTPDAIKSFSEDGYKFDAEASKSASFVFTRPQPDPKA